MRGVAARRHARLLAAVFFVVAALGTASASVQLALIEGFAARAVVIACSIALVLVGYAFARTRRWRAGLVISAVAPIIGAAGVGLLDPSDPAWPGFLVLGVAFAAIIGDVVIATASAAAALAAALGVSWTHDGVHGDVPRVVFVLIATATFVGGAFHARAASAARDVELGESLARAAAAERLAFVGRVVGGAVHDLNNVLTVVAASAELALDEQNEATRRAELVTLRDAAHAGVGLGKKLLALGSRAPRRLETLVVDDEIARVVELFRRITPPAIAVQVALDANGAKVAADATDLQQVCMNLLLNARDAIEGRGEVSLTTAWLDERARVRLTVADTGKGIPAELVAQIFEPLFTTKGTAGFGLGLANVRHIVSELSGTIAASSLVGRGTTMEVTLPAARP